MFCTRLAWLTMGVCYLLGVLAQEDQSQYITIDDDFNGGNGLDPDDGGLPSDIALILTFSGSNTVNLTLHRNRKLNTDVPIYFMDSPNEPQSVPPLQGIGFYQDLTNGAVLTAKVLKGEGGGYRQYEGIFDHASGRYELLPSNELAQRNSRSKSLKRHNMYRLRRLKHKYNTVDDTLYASDKGYNRSVDRSAHENSSKRRHRRAVGDYKYTHVELSFVVDYSEWEFWLGAASNNETEATSLLKLYFVYQMNGIDMIYNGIDVDTLGFSISVWLKEIRIARYQLESYWTANNTYGGDATKVVASDALNSFSIWRGHNSPVNWTWADPDHAMLWTKHELVNETGDSAIAGLAWLGRICENEKGTSIVEDLGYDAFLVAAHELGHNLGSSHDGDGNNCLESDGYLMAAVKANLGSLNDTKVNNPFKLSSCSLEDIANCVNGLTDGYARTCISNTVCEHTEDVTDVTYNIDEQCAINYGAGSSFCHSQYEPVGIIKYEDLCFEFWCDVPGEGCLSTSSIVPAEGTQCTLSNDGSKVCSRARCITKQQAEPGTGSCAPSFIGLEVPQSCFELDYLLRFDDGLNITCSAYVERDPATCSTQTFVKNYCCFFCKANDNTIVCPDDFGYRTPFSNGLQLTCEETTAQYPRLCMTFPEVTQFCCAACHRAGLVYVQQSTSVTSTPSTATTTITSTTQTTSVPSTRATTTTTLASTATTTNASSTIPTTTTDSPPITNTTGITTTTPHIQSTSSPLPAVTTYSSVTVITKSSTTSTVPEPATTTTYTNHMSTTTLSRTSTAATKHTTTNTQTSIEVTAVYPSHGPVSGGTRVAIFVIGARQDELAAVIIGTERVQPHSRIPGVITIRTPAGPNINMSHYISLLLTDGSVIRSLFTFTYKPDPVLTRIYPLETIRSGGTKLTVEGRNLDSVVEPFLNLTITYRGRQASRKRRQTPDGVNLSTPCLKHTVTWGRMECLVPNMRDYISQDPRDRYGLYLGLFMDGVLMYRNLTVSLPAYGQLTIYPDPIFYTWTAEKLIEPGKLISVTGYGMKNGSSIADYLVRIGQGQCTMKTLTPIQLQCLPPDTPPLQSAEDQRQGNLGYTLRVQVGHSAIYPIGIVRYKQQSTPEDLVILGIVIPLAFLLLAVMIVICVCIRYRSKTGRKDRHHTGRNKYDGQQQAVHNGYHRSLTRAYMDPTGPWYAPRTGGNGHGLDYQSSTDHRRLDRGYIFPYIGPWTTRGQRIKNVM